MAAAIERVGGASAMAVPSVAWPTLAVFVVAAGVWGGVAAGAIVGWLPEWVAVAVGSVAAYALFTSVRTGSPRL